MNDPTDIDDLGDTQSLLPSLPSHSPFPSPPPPSHEPPTHCPIIQTLFPGQISPSPFEAAFYPPSFMRFVIFFLSCLCLFFVVWIGFCEFSASATSPPTPTNFSSDHPPHSSPAYILPLLPSRIRRSPSSSLPACTHCIVKVREGTKEKETLMYQSHHSCPVQPTTCAFYNLTYSYCPSSKQCFNPKANPVQTWVRLRAGEVSGKTIIQEARYWPSRSLTFTADLCQYPSWGLGCGDKAQRHRAYARDDLYACPGAQETSTIGVTCRARDAYCTQWSCARWSSNLKWGYLTDLRLRRLPVPANCPLNKCALFNITVDDWPKFRKRWAETSKTMHVTIGVRAYAGGTDPGTILTLQEYQFREAAQTFHMSYYHEFWQEMSKPFEIPQLARNLFIQLAEVIAGSLNVTNCFVCGGTNMGDQWPWQASAWNVSTLYNATDKPAHTNDSVWELRDLPIFDFCIFRWQLAAQSVGHSLCHRQLVLNISFPPAAPHTFQPPQETTLPNGWPDEALGAKLGWPKGIPSALNISSGYRGPWPAPSGLYWICSRRAYSTLPAKWTGSCALGDVRPSFFLIPLAGSQRLSYPLYTKRSRRQAPYLSDTGTLKIGEWDRQWGGEDWPPERIIQYYGPAVWANDGMWGYQTPVYMLNRIIRLQAVVEMLTRENRAALLVLSATQMKLRNAVYQNRLALDYLLAAEGGVCGKFNLSDCCLQIDDNGKVIEEITNRMMKLAHVPVQKWTGIMDEGGFLGGLFRNWKQALLMLGIALLGLMMLPCLMPLLRSLVQSVVEASMRKQALALQVSDAFCLTDIEKGPPSSLDIPEFPMKVPPQFLDKNPS